MKTAARGKLIANEADEAAPLIKINKGEVGISGYEKHRIIERKPVMFFFVTMVVILIGGLVEFLPVFTIKSNIPTIASVHPYTPLELEGRNIYIREGCNNCHSQMIRPFRSETERYGEYSKAGEFVYDHPFLWGSKRTGPDLHRIGGKYPDSWHYYHMSDPRKTSPGSIMPAYEFLVKSDLDESDTKASISAMRRLGVPYPFGYEQQAIDDLHNQAQTIANGLNKDLAKDNINVQPQKEIVALIAYLQRLGTDIKGNKQAEIKK